MQYYFRFDYFIEFLYLKTTVKYLKTLKSTVYFMVHLFYFIYLCSCLLFEYLFLFSFIDSGPLFPENSTY